MTANLTDIELEIIGVVQTMPNLTAAEVAQLLPDAHMGTVYSACSVLAFRRILNRRKEVMPEGRKQFVYEYNSDTTTHLSRRQWRRLKRGVPSPMPVLVSPQPQEDETLAEPELEFDAPIPAPPLGQSPAEQYRVALEGIVLNYAAGLPLTMEYVQSIAQLLMRVDKETGR